MRVRWGRHSHKRNLQKIRRRRTTRIIIVLYIILLLLYIIWNRDKSDRMLLLRRCKSRRQHNEPTTVVRPLSVARLFDKQNVFHHSVYNIIIIARGKGREVLFSSYVISSYAGARVRPHNISIPMHCYYRDPLYL